MPDSIVPHNGSVATVKFLDTCPHKEVRPRCYAQPMSGVHCGVKPAGRQ